MSMSKIFNVSADCKPELHYMVDIGGFSPLRKIFHLENVVFPSLRQKTAVLRRLRYMEIIQKRPLKDSYFRGAD